MRRLALALTALLAVLLLLYARPALHTAWEVAQEGLNAIRVNATQLEGAVQSALQRLFTYLNATLSSIHIRTLPPVPPEETYNVTLTPLQKFALDYLNEVREREGVPPVQWMPLKTPQFRAEYMLKTGIYSHYDAEGREPTYYYTLLDGGKYAVGENIAAMGCGGSIYLLQRYGCHINVTGFISWAINAMVYNDSGSHWGHRISLLNPCNNYVSIGLAYNSSKVFLTIYMVSKWVRWIKPPTYNGSRFTAEGYVNDTFGSTYYVVVFYYAPNSSYVKLHHYDWGTPIATFTIYPEGKNGAFWLIDVDVPFKAQRPGLYTFVILGYYEKNIIWEPRPGERESSEREECPLDTYTIEVS
ncbi:CAP domain-containing protein [Thermoproteus tenax]|uniref:Uncharacterized protein with SCP/PR1 domains n=1 Tax=Thermoproteus tenax (strain ATCC 35583 / DSM 2078 / JCM 9277 / NBRC 100435 / Kra 1) TaxID=768679 RepID=G4RMQ2_THETK|nr:CAP domain-containing protein [Thermoproteus tenax]CCC82728.1 Uncharacterized protein with SCP/PR1 domains [Thermoproteus tenax Kra 1]